MLSLLPKYFLSSLFFIALFANAESSVWEISKGDQKLYLGGTIHILTQDDYPLPAVFDQAYNASSITVFETDIGAMQQPGVQQRMMSQSFYTDGSTITDYLQEATQSRLRQFCLDNGIPVEMFLPMKAGIASVTLTVIELQKLGLVGAGVDEFYFAKSTNDGRDILELETVDEQISLVVNMGVGNEDALINYTLDDIDRLDELMRDMKLAWRSGDMQALQQLFIVDMQALFPKLYEAMLVNRNRAWEPKIEAMLKTPDIEFVLVGAAHLVGEDGLLSLFERKGFDVKRLANN